MFTKSTYREKSQKNENRLKIHGHSSERKNLRPISPSFQHLYDLQLPFFLKSTLFVTRWTLAWFVRCSWIKLELASIENVSNSRFDVIRFSISARWLPTVAKTKPQSFSGIRLYRQRPSNIICPSTTRQRGNTGFVRQFETFFSENLTQVFTWWKWVSMTSPVWNHSVP